MSFLPINIPAGISYSAANFNVGVGFFLTITFPLIFFKSFIIFRWLYIDSINKNFGEVSVLPEYYSFVRRLIITVLFSVFAGGVLFMCLKFGAVTGVSITNVKYKTVELGGFPRWFSWSVVQCGFAAGVTGLSTYMMHNLYLDYIRKFIKGD